MSVGQYLIGGKDQAKDTSLAYQLSGKGAQDAAEEAAKLQGKSGQAAIDFQRETRDLARSDLSPYTNFATQSIGQGQQPGAVIQNQANFDPQAYLAANPDVANPTLWGNSPWEHYQMYGQGEGRQYTAKAGASTSNGTGYAADSPLGMLSNLFTQQGQTDYLKNNPLFQIGMDSLNRSSNNSFLGRGQVGSANNQIVQNAYLAGAPLLQQQTSNLFNAANLGQSSAAGQANTALSSGNSIADLITGIGNSKAAGLVGGANARQAGAGQFTQLAGTAFGMSDRRLKRNIKAAAKHGPYNTYTYQYLWSDQVYRGVMADEVKQINPDAVHTHVSGYDMVNYAAL